MFFVYYTDMLVKSMEYQKDYFSKYEKKLRNCEESGLKNATENINCN